MRDESFSEDKLVLSKAKDTIALSEKRTTPCFYGFLNEHQAQLIKDSLYIDDNCRFWGGYEDATRVMFGVNASCADFPISAVKFVYKKEYKLSHRDFLGSLMALGIERSIVGDILTFSGETVVFVKSELAQYIVDSISKIGRVGVNSLVFDTKNFDYVNEFDVIDTTVSSLRLDVFVSAICSLSRDKSQKLIKSDLVSVNHKIVNSVSKCVCVGDVITIRKFGKFVFAEENGFSKKGKLRISVKHFR